MAGVFHGFATISVVIVVGMALAHVGLVTLEGQRILATIVFYVASPALLLTLLSTSDVHELFSANLLATGGATAITAGVAIALGRLWKLQLGEAVIGVYAACYVNAANIGIPIAVYVLGNASLITPTMLLQLVVLQPLALTTLDFAQSGTRLRYCSILVRPLRNPMTVGSMLGLAVALTGWQLPSVVADPLQSLGAMSVPAMLIAYGISLRLGPLPGRGAPAGHVATTVGLKMVLQPLAAFVIGRFALDLSSHALLGVTVLAALPTAQNVFVTAVHYNRGVLLARDAVFASTITALPAILLVSALLT